MRALVIILAGFAVWGTCLGIARLAPGTSNSSMTMATIAFAAIWFIATAVTCGSASRRPDTDSWRSCPFSLQFFRGLSRYRCL